MDILNRLFQEAVQKTITTDRICYMVLKKLLKEHGIVLSKKQIEQMASDLIATESINIKIGKGQIRKSGFKTEKAFEEYFKVGYALDGTYPKRLCFRVRPSRTPFIISA